MYTTIITLHKQNTSQRKIAKYTNTHRTTVRRIIEKYENQQTESPILREKSSKLKSWHQHIVELLSLNLSNVRILEKLQDQGFNASYASLTRYVRQHNIRRNTCIRFHTEPGGEGQVDFGDVGRQFDSKGKLRKAYVFNMRLSYSRLDYYEIVFDQKIETWINCHINSFVFFGGVPEIIKLDNLKAGVINANYYEPTFQKEYKRLADHYGCLLSPCRPYQPQEKGKVESGIKYVKNNFFAGRDFKTNKEMNQQLERWLSIANERIHGTTKLKPNELFALEEKSALIKLPLLEFNSSSWHSRKLAKDCHITLENNYYSAPSKYVSKQLTVAVSFKIVKIYCEDELIATHARADGQGVFTTNSAHYDQYKKCCPGFAEHDKKYQEKMSDMGHNCAAMLAFIKQERKKDWYRAVKGIVNLRKFYDDKIIDQTCQRALHFGISSYNKIQKILESGSYNLPLAQENTPLATDNIGGEDAKAS